MKANKIEESEAAVKDLKQSMKGVTNIIQADAALSSIVGIQTVSSKLQSVTNSLSMTKTDATGSAMQKLKSFFAFLGDVKEKIASADTVVDVRPPKLD